MKPNEETVKIPENFFAYGSARRFVSENKIC